MTELMQQNDRKECQVIQNRPDKRGIALCTGADPIKSDQKPRPVQKEINPREAEEPEGAAPGWQHSLELTHRFKREQGFSQGFHFGNFGHEILNPKAEIRKKCED